MAETKASSGRIATSQIHLEFAKEIQTNHRSFQQMMGMLNTGLEA